MWKLFAYGNIFVRGKIKSKRKSLVKKEKKKTGPKKKEIVPFCQGKKNLEWKRLVLAELHAGVQITKKEVAPQQTFSYMKLKMQVLALTQNINNGLQS